VKCCNFLTTPVVPNQDTNLAATMGEVLKCHWWLCGGLICIICYLQAFYTPQLEHHSLGLSVFRRLASVKNTTNLLSIINVATCFDSQSRHQANSWTIKGAQFWDPKMFTIVTECGCKWSWYYYSNISVKTHPCVCLKLFKLGIQ